MQVGAVGSGYAPPVIDAAELTKAVVGAATSTTQTALELTKLVAGGVDPDAPAPSAEDIAAVQHALGLAIATG